MARRSSLSSGNELVISCCYGKKGISMLESTIVSAGVDYLSASMPRDATDSALWYQTCIQAIEDIAKDGNELKSTKRLGYEGWSTGGSFIGERDDSYFVNISGERAQVGFPHTYSKRAHYSRIDVQCTIRTLAKDELTAKYARDAVAAANAKLGGARQRNAILIEDLKGGATCYIGSRSSLQFARIYNKEAESGEPQYINCWRYEVQLKNVLATKTAEQFITSEYTQPQHAAMFVRQWIRKRGVRIPWKAEAELYALPTPENHTSDVETRLLWLKEQVQPTIRRLLKLGLRDTILVALGLDEAPQLGAQEYEKGGK